MLQLNRPLVTVVTPTLNGMPFLPDTIASVRAQTYDKIHHVVVDGGSTDGSLAFLKTLDPSRLSWISESDSGMYEAVNRGLELAEGEIVAYLNSDDQYLPYSVQVAVDALEKNPRAGFAYADLLNLDASDGRGTLLFFPQFRANRLQRSGLVPQPTVFVRKEVLDEVGGFDASFRFAGDLDCWARIAERYDGIHIDEVLAIEMEHGSRITADPALARTRTEELTRIRARYVGLREGSEKARRTYDAVRSAWTYRVALARFIWNFIRRGYVRPGRGWQGFLGYSRGRFEIEVSKALLALVPVLGRGSKGFIATRQRAPGRP